MRDTVSRLNSAKAATVGFLLASGLPHSLVPAPKKTLCKLKPRDNGDLENRQEPKKNVDITWWQSLSQPRLGEPLWSEASKVPGLSRMKYPLHRWSGKTSLHEILGLKYESGLILWV